MANQIVVSSGAKVRDLNDVIIGTSGVLSSLAFNVSNGVPKLDVNGKILVSQLPNSVMEYLGTWNAATNTPFLVNGTGNAGDVYLCNVAGTVDFGAGPISFVVSDQVIYSGSIWQKASGSNGTVTSVGLTSTGNDAITITGSPITTSGNINLGFAGTNLQYINGAGDLTTFPTLISSIGLSMPSAFNVSNSPLTANGTIGVTGAGVASQYIRGDGTLADFPTSGGGGSSVSYYLNGGTSQGTIGGVTYYEMSKTADTGTMADFSLTGNGFIVAFLTDAGDPAQLNIPAGNWNYEIYASMSANGGTPEMYAELYKYDGTTFTLIATSPHEILYDGTALNLYTFAMTVPSTTLAITDRLAVKLYATNSGGKTTTVHTQDSHLCQIITTFSTGITALNGLTAQVQYFATGTSGTDFNISSTTATHTFNLPVASATNTGKLSSTDWSTFNGKVPYTGATANVTLGAFDLSADDVTLTSNLASLTRDVVNSIGILRLQKGANGYIQPSTLSVDRTYTLPDASGTIALTADLTGYVTLGTTQTITGVKTFTTSNLFSGANLFTTFSQRFDQGIGILETANFGSTLGYTNIVGAVNGLALKLSDNGKKIFLFSSSTTNNTFTFPDATGTIALTSDLSSYVPYTGATTSVNIGNNLLSSASIQLNGDNTSNFGYLGFKQYAGGSSGFNGYTSIFAQGTNSINIAFSATGGSKTISFLSDLISSSTTRSYSLPDADGTIALTSSLSSYLPLAGGTLTGALNGTSAVFSSTVQASAYRLTGMTGGSGALYWTSDRVTLANYNATGVVNIEANGGTSVATFGGATYNNDFVGTLRNTTSAYFATTSGNVGIGNVSASYKLDVSGTFRTTGESLLTGNVGIGAAAASLLYAFSSTSTAELRLERGGVGDVGMRWKRNSADLGYISNADWIIAGASSTDFAVNAVNNLVFGTASTRRMTITSAGNVGIGTSSPSFKLDIETSTAGPLNTRINNTATTGNSYSQLQLQTNSGNFYIFKQNSTNSTWAGAGSANIFEEGAFPMAFYTNATERMRITSGGLFLVNVTSSLGYGSAHRIYRNVSEGDYVIDIDGGVEYSSIFMACTGGGYNINKAGQWLGKNSSNNRSINAGGTINASGADYAEYMTKAIDEIILKGDIVGVNENGKLTNIFTDAKSFVVKSTDPSYVGGDSWGSIDIIGKLSEDATEEEKAEYEIKLEEARAKVDRIAFSGQVPCNVLNANVGDYIIPIELDGKISGQAVSNPTFEQYQISVGKVWKIMEDGRAWIAVKIG